MKKTTYSSLFLLGIFVVFSLAGCQAQEKAISVLSIPKKMTAKKEAEPQKAPRPLFRKGKAVQCSVLGGQAKFSSGWFPMATSHFEMYQGDVVSVPLLKKKGKDKVDIQVSFDAVGQKIVFCPKMADGAEEGTRVSCTSVYALEDDFIAGIKRTFDVPKLVRGSALECKLKN